MFRFCNTCLQAVLIIDISDRRAELVCTIELYLMAFFSGTTVAFPYCILVRAAPSTVYKQLGKQVPMVPFRFDSGDTVGLTIAAKAKGSDRRAMREAVYGGAQISLRLARVVISYPEAIRWLSWLPVA